MSITDIKQTKAVQHASKKQRFALNQTFKDKGFEYAGTIVTKFWLKAGGGFRCQNYINLNVNFLFDFGHFTSKI